MNKSFIFLLFSFSFLLLGSGCDKSKTYAELLEEEQDAINKELQGKEVIPSAPQDDNFNTNAFYTLDNGVYMRVLDPGDLSVKAEAGDEVNLRYKRKNLFTQEEDKTFFYREATLIYGSPSLNGLGEGLEMPLKYVGLDAQVELIIPSKMGINAEISAVVPFLYTVRYTRIGVPRSQDE